jgi:hypothetical protein
VGCGFLVLAFLGTWVIQSLRLQFVPNDLVKVVRIARPEPVNRTAMGGDAIVQFNASLRFATGMYEGASACGMVDGSTRFTYLVGPSVGGAFRRQRGVPLSGRGWVFGDIGSPFSVEVSSSEPCRFVFNIRPEDLWSFVIRNPGPWQPPQANVEVYQDPEWECPGARPTYTVLEWVVLDEDWSAATEVEVLRELGPPGPPTSLLTWVTLTWTGVSSSKHGDAGTACVSDLPIPSEALPPR